VNLLLIGEKEAKHGSLFETTLSLKSEKYRSVKKRVKECVLRYHYNFSESPWHLTIGGSGADGSQNSAELYNWKTGVQCFIEPLPQVNLLKLVLKLQLIIEIFQRE